MEYPNWFNGSDARLNFEKHLKPLAGQPMQCLQIGAFTGDASVWLAENVLTHAESRLTDVDTWEGSDEKAHHEMDFQDVFKVYLEKTEPYKNIIVHRKTSDDFFHVNQKKFDFIYIDGDHTAFGVMKDAINSYNCLNVGGILAFDDYRWSEGKGNFYDPRPAIDGFMHMVGDRFQVVDVNWQVWLKKIS